MTDMHETDTLELEITDVAHGGRFVARAGEMVVFVRGALPGERVRATITKRRKKAWFAVTDDVLTPSEHRVPVPWAAGAAGVTGAADYSHADLDYQRVLKGQVIGTNARRIGGSELGERLAELAVLGVDDGDGWGTRTRYDVVKLATGAGMFLEQSHDTCQLDSQPLAVAELARLGIFTDRWDAAIAPGTRMHVVAPASGPDVVVTDSGTFSAPGEKVSDRIIEEAHTGDDSFVYELSSSGFWQVHHAAPSVLLNLVLAGADVNPGDRVLELYAGAGLFSLPLARAVGRTGALETVEGSGQAVSDAQANLAGYPWAHPHSGRIDAATVAPLVANSDVVIADPPRAGLGADLADVLARSSARKIVLVSCDPAAMARDSGRLLADREIESAHARDIFPNTHHVEIVTVFGPRRGV